MRDGLYMVAHGTITAGFVVRDGVIVRMAPVLRKDIERWRAVAIWIAP